MAAAAASDKGAPAAAPGSSGGGLLPAASDKGLPAAAASGRKLELAKTKPAKSCSRTRPDQFCIASRQPSASQTPLGHGFREEEMANREPNKVKLRCCQLRVLAL